MPNNELNATRWSAAAATIASLMYAASQTINPLAAPGSPQEGVVLACWWVAAVMSVWFCASVGLWALALRTPRTRLSQTICRVAMPGARKFAERTFALSLVVSSAACSVGGVNQAPTLSLVANNVTTEAAISVELSELPATSTSSPPTSPSRPPDFQAPESEPTTASATPSTTTEAAAPARRVEPQIRTGYEVAAGDSLWSIAQAEVAHELGANPTSTQVARYWKELVALNRDAILSGDPDLIYPGEVVLLAPTNADLAPTIVE